MGKLQVAGKYYGHCMAKAFEAAGLTGTSVDLFEVAGGPIRVHTIGFLVTTAIPAGANTLKITFTPSGGSATDLCGATDTASAGASQLFIVDGTKATGIVKTTDVGILAAGQSLSLTNIILSIGTIHAVWSSGPPATGAGMFFLEYSPLSHFTRVSVA